MVQRLKLLAFIVVVPAVVYLAAMAIQADNDQTFRRGVRRMNPNLPEPVVAALTVARFCAAQKDPAASIWCRTDHTTDTLRLASVAAAGAGLALIAAIFVAGIFARRDRRLLLALFGPGLRATALAIMALIVTHATIAVAVLLKVSGRASVMVGLGALMGLLAVARNAFALVKKVETTAIGKTVSRTDAPALWARIDDTAARLSALAPDHVVIGLDPTFYVSEANVTIPGGRVEGRTLFCSLPLARILERDEFTAVIGHELGHFRGEDTGFSQRFYPIYRGTVASLRSLSEAGGTYITAVALLPALAVFSFFLERFAIAERAHSRDRELLADQAGASVSSASSLAAALVKLHAFAAVWGGCQQAAAAAMKQGKLFVNASEVYAAAVVRQAGPASFDGIADRRTSHPTDTHPSLAQRLEALGLTVDQVAGAALQVAPTDPAIALVDDYERHEREISRTYQTLLGIQLGIRPPAPPAAAPTETVGV